MRFPDKRAEFTQTIELVGLAISCGAIFLQIWLLFSGLESLFQKHYENLPAIVFLSGAAFVTTCFSALMTNVDFLKGMREGRTKTYRMKI